LFFGFFYVVVWVFLLVCFTSDALEQSYLTFIFILWQQNKSGTGLQFCIWTFNYSEYWRDLELQ